MYAATTSDRWFGPPAVSRNGEKSLNVHSVMSSVLVSAYRRMCGSTTSRSVCPVVEPASRAVSRCDGGTEDSAAEYSIIENAVPRQMVKNTMPAIGYATRHAVLV